MLIGLFLSWWLAFVQNLPSPPVQDKPTNIILVIGDGMGLAQIAFTEYLQKPPSPIARMNVIGLQKTYSSNNLETDSGAAGTAISCGVKTFNAAIGLGADSLPVMSIMELAKAQGLKTGFVVTSSVVHATPAAFYAHVGSRASNACLALTTISGRYLRPFPARKGSSKAVKQAIFFERSIFYYRENKRRLFERKREMILTMHRRGL